MIEIKDLYFTYRGGHIPVFQGLNLQLEKKRIYGLLGKNGMGKSTLLYLISGLLRPQEGSVMVDGMASSLRTPALLRSIYLVPEEYNLPDMSLKEYIHQHAAFYPNFSEETLHRCLKDFEMDHVADLKQLSMGQKKKVYMSFALASGCRLLLMDEPTNGLDIPSKALFRKVIAGNMQEDASLIISTHQVHDVEQLLDHILILDNSRLLINAPVDEITAKYAFELRQPAEMDANVLYAEPSLQGNAVIAKRQPGSKETAINLELLFEAAITGKLNVEDQK